LDSFHVTRGHGESRKNGMIEEVQPTLFIDEADTFLKGKDELRGILNSGNQSQTAYVLRVASKARNGECGARKEAKGKGGGTRLARFSSWCPKVKSRIGRLPVTLANRCIVLPMQRKTRNEKCERLRKLKPEELKSQCARFVLDHAEAIGMSEPAIPAELNDRAGDIWEPLLVLADLAGGPWPELAREAAIGISGRTEENDPWERFCWIFWRSSRI